MIATRVKDINFLPERIVQAREKTKRRWFVGLLALTILAVALGPYAFLKWRLNNDQKELAQLQQKYKDVKIQVDLVRGLIDKRERLQSESKELRVVLGERKTWPRMLEDIEMIVPEDLWFTSLELKYLEPQPQQTETGNARSGKSSGEEKTEVPKEPPNLAVLKGKSNSLEHIGRFIYKLNGLTYFSRVQLDGIIRDEKTGTLEFTITAPLKEGAGHA